MLHEHEVGYGDEGVHRYEVSRESVNLEETARLRPAESVDHIDTRKGNQGDVRTVQAISDRCA
jgi:hypothetical protein